MEKHGFVVLTEVGAIRKAYLGFMQLLKAFFEGDSDWKETKKGGVHFNERGIPMVKSNNSADGQQHPRGVLRFQYCSLCLLRPTIFFANPKFSIALTARRCAWGASLIIVPNCTHVLGDKYLELELGHSCTVCRVNQQLYLELAHEHFPCSTPVVRPAQARVGLCVLSSLNMIISHQLYLSNVFVTSPPVSYQL